MNVQKRNMIGQGMTEYIIIVALIAVAAIGAFKYFGQTARTQVAGLSVELSGGDASKVLDKMEGLSGKAVEQSNDKNLRSYNGGNTE